MLCSMSIRTLSVIIVKNKMCQYCSLLSLSRIDSLNRSHLTELSFDIDNRVLMYRVQFNRQSEGEKVTYV